MIRARSRRTRVHNYDVVTSYESVEIDNTGPSDIYAQALNRYNELRMTYSTEDALRFIT